MRPDVKRPWRVSHGLCNSLATEKPKHAREGGRDDRQVMVISAGAFGDGKLINASKTDSRVQNGEFLTGIQECDGLVEGLGLLDLGARESRKSISPRFRGFGPAAS